MKKFLYTFLILLILCLYSIVVSFSKPEAAAANGYALINADGSVSGTTNIQCDGDIYTFTGAVSSPLEILKDHIIINGAGYSIDGSGSETGLSLVDRNNVTIANLTVNAFSLGVKISNCTDITISKSKITNNVNGILVNDFTKNITLIENNVIANNGYGLRVQETSDSEFAKNNVTDNVNGFEFSVARQNSVLENRLRNNTDCGIISCNNSANMFRSNSLSNNTCNLKVDSLLNYSLVDDFDASNTVDGKPVYYWIGKQGLTVPSDAGYVALVNCVNIRVQDLTFTNNTQILLANTNTSTIINNTIVNQNAGIYVTNSSNNIIAENNFTDIAGYSVYINSSTGNNITKNNVISSLSLSVGIFCQNSRDNVISSNNVTSTNSGKGSSQQGISINGGENNVVSANYLAGNGRGIQVVFPSNSNIISGNLLIGNKQTLWIERSNANHVFGNNVTENELGIYIEGSQNNKIHHNNFVDNVNHIESTSSNGENFLDNGYPSGGNYWSGYAKTDLYSGPYQNITGSDGIHDHAYTFSYKNVDRYPLMQPTEFYDYTSPPSSPSPTPSASPSASPSITPYPSPTPIVWPTQTPILSPSPSPTAQPTSQTNPPSQFPYNWLTYALIGVAAVLAIVVVLLVVKRNK